MTGGFAYIYDEDGRFTERLNAELVEQVDMSGLAIHQEHLKQLLEQHLEIASSHRAADILADFESELDKFILVKPIAAKVEDLLNLASRHEPELRVMAQS